MSKDQYAKLESGVPNSLARPAVNPGVLTPFNCRKAIPTISVP